MTASGKYDRTMALARELETVKRPGHLCPPGCRVVKKYECTNCDYGGGAVKARRILPVRAGDGILGEQRARWRWMDSAWMRARVAKARRGG